MDFHMHFSFCFKVVVTILKGASQLIKKKLSKKLVYYT
jgi:hypothetical protein